MPAEQEDPEINVGPTNSSNSSTTNGTSLYKIVWEKQEETDRYLTRYEKIEREAAFQCDDWSVDGELNIDGKATGDDGVYPHVQLKFDPNDGAWACYIGFTLLDVTSAPPTVVMPDAQTAGYVWDSHVRAAIQESGKKYGSTDPGSCTAEFRRVLNALQALKLSNNDIKCDTMRVQWNAQPPAHYSYSPAAGGALQPIVQGRWYSFKSAAGFLTANT
eukprot:TRINITY_DN27628_c0_g1_i1.p1 TRINITY_DN27628_c0_g1~~TRINITY_DN27628_c0_g1_i1.p1  ORF type:complete len:217 (-),score=52.57 TRINITY_DN27628_c0_g1_i1:197-847(-)